ncbi:MAG: UdgX family uracil-DNA binding protein [Actinomycetota bacterium]|nr:UdgX family uracil-DNA binding protein [Actinomycetota bacterium]
MSARTTAEPFVPDRPTLPKLRSAAATCKGCELWKSGTQTVFGEGTTRAELMLVGEQPGDKEDLAGEPFVGPAGRLLDKALEAADIDRRKVYVTNIVKHFKWEARGKRRIHKKPNLTEVSACKPWLEAEMKVVKPKVVVALGATAAQGLLGKDFRVTKQRGEPIESDPGGVVVATIHPSAILRARDEAERRKEMDGFIADLKVAAKELANAS